ncbi:MAG: hypothetical protein D6680_05640 [Cyanobacteria bacterium J007]|nr:MAG: hypothetical protein D6680_05640 [Cyanobacteria bacterium J007]
MPAIAPQFSQFWWGDPIEQNKRRDRLPCRGLRFSSQCLSQNQPQAIAPFAGVRNQLRSI